MRNSKRERNTNTNTNPWADTASRPADEGLYVGKICEMPTRYTSKNGHPAVMVPMELKKYGDKDGELYTFTDYIHGLNNIRHIKDNLAQWFGVNFNDAGEAFEYAMENDIMVKITKNGIFLNASYYRYMPEELEEPVLTAVVTEDI